ncbi:hypothetical protein OURE66S_01244 [Oligella ureolytica]
MLIEGNLVMAFSKACLENSIDSVESLKQNLVNEEFMASNEGEKLAQLLDDMILIANDSSVYSVK